MTPTFTPLKLPKNPVWDFWRDGVTSSFLNLFTQCREQTRLAYCLGYSPLVTPYYFEFGTAIHYCLEHVYARVEDESLRTPEGIRKLMKDYTKIWAKTNAMPSSKQHEQQELIAIIAEHQLPHYFQRWDGDFNGGHYTYGNPTITPRKWVQLEVQFKIPYTYPDGRQVYIRGRRDGVFMDDQDRLWVFDTKCKSVIKEDTLSDSLQHDLQQMLYLWITRAEYKVVPAGMVMNINRRPGLKRRTGESLKAYAERTANDIGNEKKNRYDHYFIRYQMEIINDDLNHWEKTFLHPIMAELRLWYEGKIPHYMNPNALESKYGRCGMYELIVRNNTRLYLVRKKAFGELD